VDSKKIGAGMNDTDQLNVVVTLEIGKTKIVVHKTPGGFETITYVGEFEKGSTVAMRTCFQSVLSAIRLHVKRSARYTIKVTVPGYSDAEFDAYMIDLDQRWAASCFSISPVPRYEYQIHRSHFTALTFAIMEMLA
jgi:hypothetical protein